MVFNGPRQPVSGVTWDDARDQQTRKLHIDYAQLGQMALDEGTIDWVLPPGAWIRVLRANGFDVEELVELCARDGASTTYVDFAPPKWARRWPGEELWEAHLR